MLKWKLQYFGHFIKRADSLEKTMLLGKNEGKRKRGLRSEELMLSNCGVEKTLERPSDYKDIKSVNPKGKTLNNHWKH